MLQGQTTLNYTSANPKQQNSNAVASAAGKLINIAKSKVGLLRAPLPAVEVIKTDLSLDPESLAKMLDEERRKRAGGGGGGFMRKLVFGPFIDFSFLMMSYLSDKARALYNALLRSNVEPTVVAKDLGNAVKEIVNKATNENTTVQTMMSSVLTNLRAIFTKVNNKMQDFSKLAKSLATNFANLATVAMSALVNKLFKLIRGKDEDIEDSFYDDKDSGLDNQGLIGQLQDFFSRRDKGEEDGSRNIFAHIENIAKQLTGFFTKKNKAAHKMLDS